MRRHQSIFSRKGNSFYIYSDLAEVLNGKDFDPINKFGIDVLSSFMIADKMIVETKKEKCAARRFIIDDIAEGWTYEAGAREEPGTKVTLFLNENCKAINIVQALQHYLKNVPIKISVRNLDAAEEIELKQSWTFSIPEIKEKVRDDVIEEFPSMSPILSLQANTELLDATLYFFEKPILDSDKNCFLLNHGIFVGSFDFFVRATRSWIALTDYKTNIIDLKVSREDVVQNDKFDDFLKKLYQNLFKAIQSYANQKFAHETDLEKYLQYSYLINKFFLSSYYIEPKSRSAFWAEEYFRNKVHLVVLKKEIQFLTGAEILEKKFEKVIHYCLLYENMQEHINSIAPELWSKCDDFDIAIFHLPSHYFFGNKPNEEHTCGLCALLRLNGVQQTVRTNLTQVLADWRFDKQATPIDDLLPEGSYFARMPDMLRGAVIQTKPFEFEGLNTSGFITGIDRFVYGYLVGKEIFADSPYIATEFEAELLDPILKSKALVQKGNFVYDINDPFLSMIISKSKFVLANQALKELVERYFRFLAISFFGSYIFMYEALANVHIITLEKTIADLLNYSEYVKLESRIRKLAKVYKKFEV